MFELSSEKNRITAFIRRLACFYIKWMNANFSCHIYKITCRNTHCNSNEGYKMSWFNLFPVGFSFSLERIKKGAKVFSSWMRFSVLMFSLLHFFLLFCFFARHSSMLSFVGMCCVWVSFGCFALYFSLQLHALRHLYNLLWPKRWKWTSGSWCDN